MPRANQSSISVQALAPAVVNAGSIASASPPVSYPADPAYPEQRLVGLRSQAAQERRRTVTRMQEAITKLMAEKRPISAETIFQISGLRYASFARNPEALILFQANSTHLREQTKANRRRKRQQGNKGKASADAPAAFQGRDRLLNCSKPELVARLRQERERREELEGQLARLVEQQATHDMERLQLEAQVAKAKTILRQLGFPGLD